MKMSDMALRLTGQPMFKIKNKVTEMEKSGRDIIHFEIGDSKTPTPMPIIEATIRSLNNGRTKYCNSQGTVELREAIARYTQKTTGMLPTIDEILVAPANSIIDLVVRCLCEPEDLVTINCASFPTYKAVLNYTGTGYLVMDVTTRTKLAIFNHPCNPTGEVVSIEDLKDFYDSCAEHGVNILSDETYSEIYYGDERPFSFLELCERPNNIITLNSFSKLFGMSGYRMGYCIADKELIEKINLLFQTTYSCMPVFCQDAAIEALRIIDDFAPERRKYLKSLRDLMVKGLYTKDRIYCPYPQGATYCFPDISGTGLTGEVFAERLLEEAGVCVLAGNCFGEGLDNYIRLCFDSDETTIYKGTQRIKKFVESL